MPCPLCPACLELTIMVSGVNVQLTVAGAKILDEDLIGGWYNQLTYPFTVRAFVRAYMVCMCAFRWIC